MTKGRRFSWRTARDEELGFHFEHGDNSNDQHDSNPEVTLMGNPDGCERIGARGMEIHHIPRNEITHNRLLANDELYIAPNEHPGMSLTSDLFDGKNFHSWCRAIKRDLFARNKLGFIDGSMPQPRIDSVDHMQWIKADYLVFNWLSNSVVKELLRGLQNLDTSKQLWDELQKRFGKHNGPRLYKIRREIASYSQHSQSVMIYFNNLSSLWDELELLKTNRICTCDASEDAKAELEEEHMMQFFMGLSDVYEPIRQQILILNPLPTVSQAYSMVLQVEEQMQVSSQYAEGTEQSALYSHQKHNYKKEGFKKRLSKEERMKLKCDHCGKPGHVKTECFEVIGIPDWYKKFKDEKNKGRVYYSDDKGASSQGSQSTVNSGNGLPDFEKVIQLEIARHFATYMNNKNKNDSPIGMRNTQSASLAEVDRNCETEEFSGHYAFGISTDIKRDEWIIDSGASNHMCCQANLLTNIRKLANPIKIFMPDGNNVWAFMTGDATITSSIQLLNVLYAPEFTHNLISVGQLTKSLNSRVVFLATHCLVQKKESDAILGIGKMKGTLYVFKHDYQFTVTINAACSSSSQSLTDLHKVLGHPSITVMKHMECCTQKRYRNEEYDSLESCDVCHRAKQQRNPFPTLARRSEVMFHLIHVDVWGPYADCGITHTPYFLTVVDDFSRATWTFLFHSKAQVWTILRSFILMIQNQFHTTIQVMRSDNGSEFVGKQTQDMLSEFGIIHQSTCVYSPQQNGVVERKHRHLLQVARALMFQSNIPAMFWPYSILFATYLINRLPSAVLKWKTPYELLHGTSAPLTAVQPFGCLVYKGYNKGQPGEVCRLVKSLYGLKQASREWNIEFCKFLFSLGFSQSESDHCMFIKGNGTSFIALLVYVDDILLLGPSLESIMHVKSQLHTAFTIKDLGEAKYFLGMEIARSTSGTFLSQRKYILDLVQSAGLLGCKPAATPLQPGISLSQQGEPLPQAASYRRIVGKLLYLNLTRPDIAYAVQQLSQFINSPTLLHWQAAMHVLRYLKGCPSLGLHYRVCDSFDLAAFCDADWGSCTDTRKSLTGYCIFLGKNLVSWKCKKQTTVSLSTAEAEYRSLSFTVRELLWLSFMLDNFHIPYSKPIHVFCDNKAAIQITQNQVYHERTKHLDLDCHFARSQFKCGFILPVYVSTDAQLADIFTKSLAGPRFRDLLSKLNLGDLHQVKLAGGC